MPCSFSLIKKVNYTWEENPYENFSEFLVDFLVKYSQEYLSMNFTKFEQKLFKRIFLKFTK